MPNPKHKTRATRDGAGIHIANTPEEQAAVDAAVVDWEAKAPERVAKAVDEKRRIEYGPLEDQLDMIYWSQVNKTTTWRDHVAAVKAANPKP